jgi:phenylpropionate dioxygenase-like ring-hydroxylating dioxygenase large terminal subunit
MNLKHRDIPGVGSPLAIEEQDMTVIATAYDREPGTHDPDLTEVGRGTPMGELMRRYWQPVGIAQDATDLPKMVRALGEDLVLFRGKNGKAGLVHPRCVHRGSSLFYGRVEDDGIRCCYHGWKFGVDGTCLDQPMEPNGGVRSDVFRQPWYPVEERYGLIFAYMGPAAKKPLLPRYSVLENLPEGTTLHTDTNNIGAGTRPVPGEVVPFNWMQHFENIHDPAHFLWLHYMHSGPQFGARFGEIDQILADPPKYVAGVTFEENANGVIAKRDNVLPDGRALATRVETMLPCIRAVPNPRGAEGPADHLGFILPVDDTSFRIFTVGFDPMMFKGYEMVLTERWKQMDEDMSSVQREPNDLEAQGSQGPITLHSEEKLVSSDRGVVMLRRLFRRQMDIVASGGDPIGVSFDNDLRIVEAGSFITPAQMEAAE